MAASYRLGEEDKYVTGRKKELSMGKDLDRMKARFEEKFKSSPSQQYITETLHKSMMDSTVKSYKEILSEVGELNKTDPVLKDAVFKEWNQMLRHSVTDKIVANTDK